MKAITTIFCTALLSTVFPLSPLAQTLGDALNAPNLTWTTSGTMGALGWLAGTSYSHDGVAAAMSGSVSGSRTSSLEATVNGPGTLTFWWSNPSLFNSLSFEVGSNRLASLTAYPSWQQQTIYVGAGQQTFRWTYSPGPSFDFSSRGYVDEVTYTPGETKPVITSQPTGQSQLPGLAVTYKVDAGGTPPLSYQWRFKGADLPGATTSSFTITNVQPAVLGNYSVLVTNSGGSILSPDAPLEFGELTGWGSGFFGETAIPTGASNVLAITAGDYYSAMLRADRTVTAWGRNTSGQTICPEDLTNVIAIAAGAFHCLALKADGTVISWGDNRYNQTNVPVGLTNVVAIAGGLFHSLALRADGSVVAWGGNPYNTNSETNVPPGLTNVVAVSAKGFSLALKSDGTVVSWGPAPTAPRDLTNVIGVAVGQSHGLALLANRTVVAWGDNYAGQTDVPAGLTNVAAVSTGLSHSLARLADGTVKGWGRSAYAQSLIPSSLSNITAIAAGSAHNLALVGSAPPQIHHALNSLSVVNNEFRLSMPSQSGRVYALQYRRSLTEAEWTTLPLVAGTGTNLNFIHPISSSQLFFRVLCW